MRFLGVERVKFNFQILPALLYARELWVLKEKE